MRTRGSTARGYGLQVSCLGGGVSSRGWSSSSSGGVPKATCTGWTEGPASGATEGIIIGAKTWQCPATASDFVDSPSSELPPGGTAASEAKVDAKAPSKHPSRVCKGVCKTNKKIHESNKHQQRPANPRRLQLRWCTTDPMFHCLRLANFVSEHYYFVGNRFRNLSLSANLIFLQHYPKALRKHTLPNREREYLRRQRAGTTMTSPGSWSGGRPRGNSPDQELTVRTLQRSGLPGSGFGIHDAKSLHPDIAAGLPKFKDPLSRYDLP